MGLNQLCKLVSDGLGIQMGKREHEKKRQGNKRFRRMMWQQNKWIMLSVITEISQMPMNGTWEEKNGHICTWKAEMQRLHTAITHTDIAHVHFSACSKDSWSQISALYLSEETRNKSIWILVVLRFNCNGRQAKVGLEIFGLPSSLEFWSQQHKCQHVDNRLYLQCNYSVKGYEHSLQGCDLYIFSQLSTAPVPL